MKYLLPLIFGFCVLLIADHVCAGNDDICAKVTCGNHGNCIVKTDGNPVCACHEGYSPDASTGLSCLPVSSAKAAKESKPAAKPKAKKVPPPPPGQQCSVDEHCKHYKVCYEGRCIAKSKRNQYLEWSNMTAEQRTKKSGNMILSGWILTGIGGAAMIVGFTNIFVGALNDEKTIFRSGLVIAPIGMVSLVVGVSLASTGTKIKNYPPRHEKIGFSIPTKNRKITLQPAFAVEHNAGLFGLSGRF
jgi:hypothetical protein